MIRDPNYPNIYVHFIDEICAPVISIGDNIKDYYVISNYGMVFNKNTGGEVIPHENHMGYYQVSLMSNGPTERVYRKVHRLVMMTFCYFDGCELLQVNHKDGNKKNNSYRNLEWVTPQQNIDHAMENNLRVPLNKRSYTPFFTDDEVRTVVEMVIYGVPEDDIINTVCKGNVQEFRNIIYGKEWDHIISKEDRKNIYLARTKYSLSLSDKHAVCKYFQDNKNMYTNKQQLIRDALISIGKDPTLIKNISSASVLLYKRKCPEITSMYDF